MISKNVQGFSSGFPQNSAGLVGLTLKFSLMHKQSRHHVRHFGAVPPKSLLVPPPKREICPTSEDCAPKKATGLVPLECSLGPKTPEVMVIHLVFAGKFFAHFAMKTFFGLQPRICMFRDEDLFCGLHSRIRRKKIFALPKNCLCPPVTLLWRRASAQE